MIRFGGLQNVKIISTTVLAIFLVACGRGRSGDDSLANSLVLSNDVTALGTRVSAAAQQVFINGLGLTGKPVATTFTLTLVAHIAPPSVGGSSLQATKVVVLGKQAYVSYNLAGDPQAGAVDVIDVSGATPRITSELISTDADINSIAVESTALYAEGARNGKAFARRIGLINSNLTLDVRDADLASYAGTGAAISNGFLYATSGSGGALTVFKKDDLSRTAETLLTDARDVAANKNGNGIVVVAGTPGRIAALDNNGALLSIKDVGGATIKESKSSIEAGKYTTLVALGDGGAKLFCGTGASPIASISPATAAGISALQTVTNAASASGGLLFTADGEAGVRVFGIKGKKNNNKCESVDLPLLGSLNFGKQLSANGITYDGNYIYVASGLGGLEILRIDGVKSEDGDSDEFDAS